MADGSFEEKTEKPTPKRREEAREKGEVAKSRELPSVAVLLTAMVILALSGSHLYAQIQKIMRGALSLPLTGDLSLTDFMAFAQEMMMLFILSMIPLFSGIVIAALLSNIVQVGFMLSPELIKPKLSKLDPMKGVQRLFSRQSFMELFKTISKLGIVGTVAYLALIGEMRHLISVADTDPNAIFMYILITLFKISIKCTAVILLLAIMDYAFQRWEFEKRIKMSRKEIKDEFKRTEGDPLIKSRIRSIQMQMARRRMMQDVPKADVVITNPTHLAVALSYDSSLMHAPKVLAKGAGDIAKKIKDVAEKHQIPIVENKELARNLYKLVDVGREIPSALYHAVAEVLAYIYKLKGRSIGGMR